MNKETHEFIYNGIDRKNNDMGYRLDNCVSCCTLCNRRKGGMEYAEFITWILKAATHLQKNQEVTLSHPTQPIMCSEFR